MDGKGWATLLGGLMLAACSASGGSGNDGAGNASGTGGFAAGGMGGSGAAPPLDGGGAGPSDLVGEVYGHSALTLYKLEPFSKTVSIVGNFDCLGGANPALGAGMWDIALDKNGRMIGVKGGLSGAVMEIEAATAHCTVISQGTYPNSLTFVPAGTIDPSAEVLVGYNKATYVRIDPQSGTTTNIGSLNPNGTGQAWESSGDIVSIIDDKTYLTAKPQGSNSDTTIDSILEVDPKTGTALRVIGSTGFPKLWGLGYWAGTAYGFSEAGHLAEIDLSTGAGQSIPLQGDLAGLAFWGAGVTTAAPIDVPH